MFDKDAIARAGGPSAASGKPTELREFLARQPEARTEYRTLSGLPLKRVYTAGGCRRPAVRSGRPARAVPLHARPVPHDVPGPAVDDAADRRLRDRRGHESAIPLLDRPGSDGIVGGLRHADPDGLRLRRPAGARRGGAGRRGRGHPRRRRRALRRHRSREDLGVDDDQPFGLHLAGHVRGPGPGARVRPPPAVGHDPGRHPQGVRGSEGVDLPHPALAAAGARHDHLLRRAHGPLQPHQYQRLPHLRGGGDLGAGSGLHHGQRHRLRGRGASDRRGRRRFRAPPGLLLRGPGRLLRGGGQVPGGPSSVGADHEGALRRRRARNRCGCASTARRQRPR